MTIKNFLNSFRKKYKDLYDYKYDYSTETLTNSDEITFICENNHSSTMSIGQHLKGYGCKLCAKKLKIQKYIKEANINHNNKYDYTHINEYTFTKLKSKVKIICPIHGEFETWFHRHIKGNCHCPQCIKSSKTIALNEQIQKANIIHNDRYSYNENTTFEKLKDKVEIICESHGTFTQNFNNHLQGQGCPLCKSSKGENKIRNLLNQNNIEFQEQFSFKNCSDKQKLIFDFYIEKLNICIEYDGIQHYEPIDFFGGEIEFINIQKRDEIKNEFCKLNNILLIRIPYMWKDETLSQFIKDLVIEYNQ